MRNALLMPLLALAACATAPAGPAGPAATGPVGTCRSDALASFVSQPATQALGAQILAASGAKTLRWVAKGMMVTMDYREDRVTVYLDAINRIERASCG